MKVQLAKLKDEEEKSDKPKTPHTVSDASCQRSLCGDEVL